MPASSANLSDLERLRAGGAQAFAELFLEYEERLERMVSFRLDSRVAKRVDPGDILQEAYLVASRRCDEYLASPTVSFYVWLRQLTFQQVLAAHRWHFRQKRDARQELRRRSSVGSTSLAIAEALIADQTSPSQAMLQAEHLEQLEEAFENLDEIDREVLALRHFEQLGNDEAAEVLGLSKTAASNRYVRAVRRLGLLIRRL